MLVSYTQMESSSTSRIVVVEDDRAVARAIARMLRRRGYSVSVCHSADGALVRPGVFHTGVFDVDLPDGSGIEVARKMMNEGRVEHAIFFSASPKPGVASRAAKLGKYIHKAEGVGELARAVADTMEERLKKKVANGTVLDTSRPARKRKSGTRKRLDSEG